MELLEKLTQTPGVPGREERIRDVILQAAGDLFDETRVDSLGTLIGVRRPRPADGRPIDKPTRVMLAAHMDQIGFLVRHVDDKGFLRVQNVGGFDPRNLFARLVTVCTATGDLTGILNPGGKPVHIASDEDRRKVPEINDLIVDLGLPAEQVKEQVRVGDMVVIQAPFAQVGQSVVAQAMDNRVSCWAAIGALQKLGHHDCEIHVAFTVQEEVGCRGAGPAAEAIAPDITIVLDTTLCCDTPGVPEDMRITRQGDGVGLLVMDSSMIANPALLEQLEQIAQRCRIKAQRTILPRGGTDGATIHTRLTGQRVATLVCPTRYIHTITEAVHLDDLHAMRDLLAAYLEVAA